MFDAVTIGGGAGAPITDATPAAREGTPTPRPGVAGASVAGPRAGICWFVGEDAEEGEEGEDIAR